MTTTEVTRATEQVLVALSDAIRCGDRDGAKALFAPDAIYAPGTGTAVYKGPDEVVEALFATNERFEWFAFGSVRRFVAGEQAYAEWRLSAKSRDGVGYNVHGCDYFEVRDGKIRLKNTFLNCP